MSTQSVFTSEFGWFGIRNCSACRASGSAPRQRTIRIFLGLCVMALAVAGTTLPPACHGYTPDSPEVKQMVDRGVAYLERLDANVIGHDGYKMLVAYAHLKCRHDVEAPIVKRGIEVALNWVNGKNLESNLKTHDRTYSLGVSVLLLAEADPEKYRGTLEKLSRIFADIQQNAGGYGYPGSSPGDISQTQYAILAAWTLDRNGIDVNYDKVAKSLGFLMRVQDTSGGWPYNAKDPGPGRPLTKQAGVDHSMGLAGGSSLLIAADALGVWGQSDDKDPGIPGLPKAIKLYVEETNQEKRVTSSIPKAPLKQRLGFLDQYLLKNPYKRSALDYYYYVIYSLERYESFVEIANDLPKDKSPDWYNRIVDELRELQDKERGGWTDRSYISPPASTAFALLFLIRSTQKAIGIVGTGSLGGGQGFPSDTTKLRVDGTQIKGQPVATQVTDLLSVLEDDGGGDVEGKSIPDDLQLAKDPSDRRAQIDRLERLVRGSQSYQARRVAAKLLGRSDEMRVVPSLIFALSDLDTPTRRFARDGLRFISRKFDGMGEMPDRPDDIDNAELMGRWNQQIEEIQSKWRQWYASVDPTYIFLN